MLSICIPTLNRADLLEKNLKNLLTFDNINIEVNISNNGSSDHTLEVIKKYESKFKAFNYVSYAETIDVISNWDSAIRLATKKYVFALADDDNALEEGLLKAISLLESDDDLISVYGGYKEYNLQEEFLTETKKCDVTEVYDNKNRLELVQKHWSFEVPVFRNSFYINNATTHQNSWILSWSFLSTVLKKGKIAATPYCLFKHYIHKNRFTETDAANAHFNFVCISEMEIYLANTPGDPNVKLQTLINYSVRLFNFNAAVCLRNNDFLQARFFIAKGMYYHKDFAKFAENWDKNHLIRATAQDIKQRIAIKDFIGRLILISDSPKQLTFLSQLLGDTPISNIVSLSDSQKIENYNHQSDFIVFFDDKEINNYDNKQNVVSFTNVMSALKFTENELNINI